LIFRVEQVHPWVNYDQILSKCYVGTLKPHAEFDPTEVFKPAEKSPPKALNEETANNATNKEPILLPRFDWIQKLDYITIIFYTGNFSNPMLEVNRADDKTFHIFLTYSGHVFDNEIMFADKVHWPCRIRVGCETGKVELVYRKCQGSVWDNFGVLKQKSKAKAKALVESRLKCKVANKTKVNYNTFLIELERSDGNRSIVPLGKHIKVFDTIKGKKLRDVNESCRLPNDDISTLDLGSIDLVCFAFRGGNRAELHPSPQLPLRQVPRAALHHRQRLPDGEALPRRQPQQDPGRLPDRRHRDHLQAPGVIQFARHRAARDVHRSGGRDGDHADVFDHFFLAGEEDTEMVTSSNN
jgi:hypothetical protein